MMIVIALMAIVAAAGAFSSQDIKVTEHIPKEAEVGKSVSLECSWQLAGNGSLYTVKWTKNDYEIFSYNPENEQNDRVKTFPRDGFGIEVSKNQVDSVAQSYNKISIRLSHLTLNSSGQYRCEVSTGAPFYHTNFKQSNMTVILPPTQPPSIYGVNDYYAMGEKLRANCSASPSVPRANLQWIVNNRTVSRSEVIEYPTLARVPGGFPNILGLRMIINANLLHGSHGKLRVRCIASVGTKQYTAEKTAALAHANNQPFSSDDPRNSASYSAICSVTLLVVTAIIAT